MTLVVNTRVLRCLLARCCLALVLATSLASCQPAAPAQAISVSGLAYFSMPWQAKVTSLPTGMTATQLQRVLQLRLDAANAVLSTYQPDTEIMRFNRAPVGAWIEISPLLLRAVTRALQVSAASQGAYDITIAPLVNIWGFGPKGRVTHMPSEADIRRAQAQVDWRQLELDVKGSRLRKHAAVTIDLSSVGEGVGSDDLADTLNRLGIQHFLVSVAGSLRSQGHRADGKPWRLAIEQPDGSGRVAQVLDIAEGAISTSGSYRNYFEDNGVRYSHTLNPATGRPINHRGVSVTVVSPRADDDTLADAWATALNVLGPERGLALAESQGLAAYFIERTDTGFASRHTAAFTPYLMH